MASKYHVYVGAETGLLKGVDVEQNKWDNLNLLEEVKRSNEICTMCWESQQEKKIVYGTRAGLVRTFSLDDHTTTDTLQATDNDDEILKGLFKLDEKYVTCTSTGKLKVWDESNEDQVTIDCGVDIECMRQNPGSLHRVATGGKENDLKIYDLNKPTSGPIFRAKNVRDDFLDLRVPIWVTDIDQPSDNLVITVSRHHQLRLYDLSGTMRRPVVDMLWRESPITSLTMNPANDRQCILGNAIGEQGLVDLRTKQTVHCFKGGAGSIRAVLWHPNESVVASCGLDRYLRIHDVNSRQLLHKVYLKSRLNQMLVTTEWVDKNENKDVLDTVKQEITEQDEEDDALWSAIEPINTEPVVKKAKDADTNTSLVTKRARKGKSRGRK